MNDRMTFTTSIEQRCLRKRVLCVDIGTRFQQQHHHFLVCSEELGYDWLEIRRDIIMRLGWDWYRYGMSTWYLFKQAKCSGLLLRADSLLTFAPAASKILAISRWAGVAPLAARARAVMPDSSFASRLNPPFANSFWTTSREPSLAASNNSTSPSVFSNNDNAFCSWATRASISARFRSIASDMTASSRFLLSMSAAGQVCIRGCVGWGCVFVEGVLWEGMLWEGVYQRVCYERMS